MSTVVIVASCESYRTGDFVAAARNARLEVVVATDAPSPFADGSLSILVDLEDPDTAAETIAAGVPGARAVVAVDDQGVRTATRASELLELARNPQSAVEATRDKLTMRRLLDAAGILQPAYAAVPVGELPSRGSAVGYPVVVKPTGLSGSRGVIRVDNSRDARQAEARVRDIVRAAGGNPADELIAEQYIDGHEIVIEGLVHDGDLQVLAVIDKPVPLVGPYFEETMFVTPSRLAGHVQTDAIAIVADALGAIGIETGPIHAELRIDSHDQPWVIEIAARSIGGLCGRSLTFGLLGESLESVILAAAVGRASVSREPATPSSGVLMIPIPASGTLTGVEGIDEAANIEFVTSIELTTKLGADVRVTPEGDRYIGFVFANGPDPKAVTEALSTAARSIEVVVDGEAVASGGQVDATQVGA